MLTQVQYWKLFHLKIVADKCVSANTLKKFELKCKQEKLSKATADTLIKSFSVLRSEETLQRIESIENGTFPYFVFVPPKVVTEDLRQ